MYLSLWERQQPTPEDLSSPDAGVHKNIQLILGVAVGSILLATLSVVIRFLCRKSRKMPLLADDWVMVLGLLFTVADAAAYIWGLRYGFGKHIWTLQPENGVDFGKLVFATFQLYGGAVTMIKLSVLLFYHRVFGRKYRTWLIVLATLSIIWWIVISLASAFQCTPVAKSWNPELPGKCIPYLNIFIGIQCTNIALDIAILVLPISAVVKLQMSTAKKYSVGGTFGLGGLSIVFAAVRLYILIRDQNQTDVSFETATANWSLVEPAFELFCGCIPCMAPLLHTGKYLSKLKNRLYGSNSLYSSRNTSHGSKNINGREQFHTITNQKAWRHPSPNSADDIPLRQIN